jgi:beta-carotene 3-hydroxylase
LEILVNTFCFFAALAFMEVVAFLAHKYVMHGFLWVLHESHHRPRESLVDKNDLFAVFFALPAILLIYYGASGPSWALWAGLGTTAYGFVVYFGFHDVVVHRRIPNSWRPGGKYLLRMMHAHRLHHALEEKEGAVSFGFAYAKPIPVLRAQMKAIEAKREVQQHAN